MFLFDQEVVSIFNRAFNEFAPESDELFLFHTNIAAIDEDCEVRPAQLHLTLAYKYDKMDSITLSSMLDRFEYVDASAWELRLYSRDIRIDQNQVSSHHVEYLFVSYFLNFDLLKLGISSNGQLSRTSS